MYTNKMLQYEDEDECEYFFLRSNNGYNIVEKIKLANRELFETPHPSENITITDTIQRVTFRQSLVDYAPEYSKEELYCNEMNKSNVNALGQQRHMMKVDNEEESSDCKMDDEITEELYSNDDDDAKQCITNEKIKTLA